LTTAARRGGWKAAHRSGLVTQSDLRQLRAGLSAAVAELAPRVEWACTRLDGLEARERQHVQALEVFRNLTAIDAVTRWIKYAELSTTPLISVVMPTKDRPEQLARAIRSVLAQRYENWELLVHDSGDPGSREAVDAIGDRRIVWSRSPQPGNTAGRNHALHLARGELITYLDDDNIMDPDWLFAVVWAFEQRPDIDVLYGAHVVDDHLRASGESSGALPSTHFNQWSRDRLKQANLTDMSAIAHRAGLPEARFDDEVKVGEDWDLLLRLTTEKDPLMLPVIACYYTSDAPRRIRVKPTYQHDLEAVAARTGAR
jgi:hypothetical protein